MRSERKLKCRQRNLADVATIWRKGGWRGVLAATEIVERLYKVRGIKVHRVARQCRMRASRRRQ